MPFFDEFHEGTKKWERRENLASTTIKRYAFAEGQVVEFSDQWLQHQRGRNEGQEVDLPEDWDEATKSSFTFPREYLLSMAVVCCRPRIELRQSDVTHPEYKVS